MSRGKYQKGVSGNPAGRPKGIQNKQTQEIRQAYIDLVHGNLDQIANWLNQVALNDPAKAFELLLKISPFIIPRKTEMDVSIDNPIKIVIPEKKSNNSSEE